MTQDPLLEGRAYWVRFYDSLGFHSDWTLFRYYEEHGWKLQRIIEPMNKRNQEWLLIPTAEEIREQRAIDKTFQEMFSASRPIIVCLCGSTRFGDAFREANLKETLAGKTVLSIGCDFKSDQALGLNESDKIRLDELHKRKIDLCDEILVLNVGGYIGNSTRSEIEYAEKLGRRIRYLEDAKGGQE